MRYAISGNFKPCANDLALSHQRNNSRYFQTPDDITRSLLLAICVAYRTSLQQEQDRFSFDDQLARSFSGALRLPGGSDSIGREISA